MVPADPAAYRCVMRRDIFAEEHEAFRGMVREFIAREVTPYHEQWELDGVVSRDVWLAVLPAISEPAT